MKTSDAFLNVLQCEQVNRRATHINSSLHFLLNVFIVTVYKKAAMLWVKQTDVSPPVLNLPQVNPLSDVVLLQKYIQNA